MRQGFMLIELIVASLVASMVAAILLAALAQSNRFQTIVDNLVDTSVRIGVVSHQLEKDLMGAFIPTSSFAKASSAAKALEDKSEAKQGTSGGEKKEAVQAAPEKKEEKVLGKIFYSTNKNGQFDTLTFITNNPLVVYVGKDVGVVKPKVVRVQYTLKPEAEKKDSYALFRQESMELDLDLYKNVTAYEVIGGIKNCTMTFTARIKKEQEQGKAPTETKSEKVEYEYKVLNEWVSEQKKESSFAKATEDRAEKKEKEEFPRIPYSVEIKMILWDLQDKREKEFTIVCQIPTDFSEPKEEDKQVEQSQTQENKNEPTQDKNKSQTTETAQNQIKNTENIIIIADGNERIAIQTQDLTKIFGRK